MGSIANEIATIKQQLDAATAATQTLAAGILALKAEISNTGDQLSPSTQAALDAVAEQASALAAAEASAVSELPPTSTTAAPQA